MWGLLHTGAWQLDNLQGVQMASQEVSGIMVAVMLQQQGGNARGVGVGVRS